MSQEFDDHELTEDQFALLEMMLADEALLDKDGGLKIEPRPDNERIPLSFAQARVWFLEQMYGSMGAHNIHVALHLKGKLDLIALGHAANVVWQRHESLRSGCSDHNGEPYQFVRPHEKFSLATTDLRGYAQVQREEALANKLEQEAEYRFDLQQDMLARLELIILARDEQVLSLTLHHIIADGWSINLLLGELVETYAASQSGRAPELPELTIQYGDYAYWQRREQANATYFAQLEYWREKLAIPPVAVELPPDKVSDKGVFLGEKVQFNLSGTSGARLRLIGREAGATLFMVLLAAFKLHVAGFTRRNDIVIGVPVAGRSLTQLEPVIGVFVNTLALRTDLGGLPTFRRLLDRVKQTTLDGMANQDVPFEQLVAELNPPRSFGRNPYFECFFNMLNFENQVDNLLDIEATWLHQTEPNAQFDITINAEEDGKCIAFTIVYDKSRFDRAHIDRFAGGYRDLLEQVAQDPDVTINLETDENDGAAVVTLPASSPIATSSSKSSRPVSPTEHTLMQIWHEILQLPDIGIHDDFFAIGGHSLLAVRMFNQIRKHLDVKLRLAIMYDNRTIAQLAQIIDGVGRDGEISPASVESSQKSLVKIADGAPGIQPLYCVHGAGGHVMFLHEWQEHLAEIPLYGFQARGFDDIAEAHHSIEDMAATYVAELVKHQPDGPYMIAGYSGGGVVAFEMVQQLKRLGYATSLLALVDTFHPTVRPRRLGLFERVREVLKDPLRFLRKFYRVKIAWRLTEFRTARNNQSEHEEQPLEHREFYMFDHFDRLWTEYQAQSYDGSVLLLRAQEEWIIFDHVDNSKGWLADVRDLTIRVVPGDHRSLITQPNLTVTLNVLREELLAKQAQRNA